MPFKQDVIPLVDTVEDSARAINAVNTIVNDDGHLTASNTDYIAVQRLIEEHGLDGSQSVLIHGSGGMASAVGAAFRDSGFHNGLVVARNAETGAALARQLDYDYAPEVGSRTADVIVNVTPIGMAGGPDERSSAFDTSTIIKADTVFDVVALPSETPLIIAAREAGVKVDHRWRGDRAAGRRTVRALHGRAADGRAGGRRVGGIAGLTTAPV